MHEQCSFELVFTFKDMEEGCMTRIGDGLTAEGIICNIISFTLHMFGLPLRSK